jgi:hypothetical protein
VTPAVFVDAMRRVRAVLEEAEDAGIGLMQYEPKWQLIDLNDRATWPPLGRPVLTSEHGGSVHTFTFDAYENQLLRGPWRVLKGEGLAWLAFPPPPKAP